MRDQGATHHRRVLWRRAALAIVVWCLTAAAAAHDFIVVRAAVVVDRDTVTVTLLIAQGDLLVALGERRLAFSGPDELREFAPRISQYLLAGTHVRVGGVELPLRYLGPIATEGEELPPQLTLALRGDASSAPSTTSLRIDLFAEHRVPLIATVELRADGVIQKRTVGRGEEVTIGGAVSEPTASTAHAETGKRTALDWLRIGIERFVRNRVDHILFVLGLCLLSPRLKPLLTQIAAFTVGHSLTLGLSALGKISLPSRVLEPLIAASIAFVAIGNIATRELKPWRWLLVFGFGLVHGLGLGGALAGFLSPDHVVVPLALLNCGVELGQFSVVAAAAALTCWCWRRPWYRRGIVIPASIAIAAYGVIWTVERIMTPVSPSAFMAATLDARG